jgi:HAD superfamily hydrolase (TIGR01450 family)
LTRKAVRLEANTPNSSLKLVDRKSEKAYNEIKMSKLYLVDIEGTIVKDKSYAPIEGAVDWINSFGSSPDQFVLVSNNTTHKPEDLLVTLKNLRFNLRPKNLMTCMGVALSWLKKKEIKNCFVIGSSELREYLNENGIETPTDDKVEAVLVGLDCSLDYEKLKIAVNALVKNHASFLALHANRLYKDEKGELCPSVGAVVKALEYSSQRRAKVFGKPNPEIYREAMARFDVKAENCIMISDDPLSDLVGAKKLGMKTVFVTSGKYKDVSILKGLSQGLQPDWIHASVKEIRIQ